MCPTSWKVTVGEVVKIIAENRLVFGNGPQDPSIYQGTTTTMKPLAELIKDYDSITDRLRFYTREIQKVLDWQEEVNKNLAAQEVKNEEAAKALLTAVFGAYQGGFKHVNQVERLDNNAEAPGIPLTDIFNRSASAVKNEINDSDPAKTLRPTLGSNPYQTR